MAAGWSTGGYIIVQNLWEQLTSGSRNLLGLQCWAGKVRMSITEPFLRGTYFSAPAAQRHPTDLLRFSDIYDIDHWNRMSKQNEYAPLIKWEHFLMRAPRNLIVVDLKYGGKSHDQHPNRKGYRQKCSTPIPSSKEVIFLKTLNFTAMREICIDFSHGNHLNIDEFNTEIFGDQEPSNSTVLFTQWRGFASSSNRINVRGSGCVKLKMYLAAQLSKRLIRDGDRYMERYLRTPNYIAIVARMEKAKKVKHDKGMVTYCFKQTIQHWEKLSKRTGINTTFLSIDIGRFGSDTFIRTGDDTSLKDAFLTFFHQLYGSEATYRKWEATFEEVSSSSESGYIASLQKGLASQAKCVLLVGGGTFQRNTLRLYYKTHPKKTDQCVYIVKNCTRVEKLLESAVTSLRP